MIRTRIAPSPTGENLHIGNVYAALLNFAFAHKSNGKFIVRIEDTDRTRLVEGSEDRILDSLSWLGLSPDESTRIGGPFAPYRQSERLKIYHEYAQKLLDKDLAYIAFLDHETAGKKKDYTSTDNIRQNVSENAKEFDAPKSIEEMPLNGDWVVKMRVPKDQQISFNDVIHGEIKFNSNDVTEQVLIKSDKFPTYHFAVVVDDHLMEITHIIRAEEWISSTPKHILLYKAFDWDLPVFAHIPILRNPDKSKLSKRKNPVWVSWYRDEGFLPEAILNYLALMGWSHPQGKEIFSLDEFTKVFDLKDVKPVGPIFDIEKLRWMNGEYIRNLTIDGLTKNLKDFFANDNEVLNFFENNKHYTDSILGLAQTRMKTLKEFKDLIILQKIEYSLLEKEMAKDLKSFFENITDWNKEKILEAMRETLKKHQVKGSILYKILTGRDKGLPLPDYLEVIGKENSISRLNF